MNCTGRIRVLEYHVNSVYKTNGKCSIIFERVEIVMREVVYCNNIAFFGSKREVMFNV